MNYDVVMELVENMAEINNYATERAKQFGRSSEELRELLGGFSMFLANEDDKTPILDWIDDADIPLVTGDERIIDIQNELQRQRKTKNEELAIERSRSTEWVVLLEKFLEVTPVTDNATSAA